MVGGEGKKDISSPKSSYPKKWQGEKRLFVWPRALKWAEIGWWVEGGEGGRSV